jgi:hypothetical protein
MADRHKISASIIPFDPVAKRALVTVCALLALIGLGGCQSLGYSNESLFPQDIQTISLKMFDNRTFWRNIEYDLTDALAKQIESKTPYKIISDQDLSDTTMTGQITKVFQNVLMTDRDTGDDLQMELTVQALVTWKNLKTGDLLCDNLEVVASGSYSTPLGQNQGYASKLTANKLASKIVELMENKW